MTMFLVILSLFSLLSYGYSLSCVSCFSGTETNCTGGSVACSDGDQCSSLYMVTTINGATAKNFFRSCAPKNQCNVTGSSSFPGGTLQMASTCCTVENRCTPNEPQFASPATNNTWANGIVCRQCQTINSDRCDTQNSTVCYGNESMCIRLSTITSGYPQEESVLAFRGCATRSVCDMNQQLFKTSGLSTVYNYICTSAATGLHYGSIILLTFFVFILNVTS